MSGRIAKTLESTDRTRGVLIIERDDGSFSLDVHGEKQRERGEALITSRTGHMDAYEEYLRARALVRARGNSISEAIVILEQLVGSDAQFAPAWALLAYAYYLLPVYHSGAARSGSIEAGRLFVQSAYQKSLGQ